MTWSDACFGFVRKYGSTAKVVAGAVLNVVAPGSAALVGLVGTACDAAQDYAQKQFEERLLATVQQNTQEVARLGQLFAVLAGDLAHLCDKAHEEADITHQSIEIEASVRKALARDPNLVQSLRKIDALTSRFDCLEEQNRRLLDGQDEMLPILRRLNRVADFVDECVLAGLSARDLAESLRQRQVAVADIQRGQGRAARTQVVALGARLPASASVHVLAAGAAVVLGDLPEVQAELGKAADFRPDDPELREMHREVTVMVTSPKVGTSRHPKPSGPAQIQLQPGDVLDGWTLEARLGDGGWGQVFRAKRGDEVRALKVMHPKFSGDERFLKRFRGEIRALASLPRHDNLVRLTDFNFSRQRDCWYLEMEYLDGPTLEQYLTQKGPLTPELVRKIFLPVAEGLGQAHAAFLFHRDIKPSNLIFRKRDQKLVLVDFGLAIHSADEGHTEIGGMTLKFAPLEQLRGGSANARSDVYSLAATMYFALLHDRPDVRGLFDADLAPADLRPILTRALHPTNPMNRPANGAELADWLRAPVAPVIVTPPPLPPPETPVQRVKRLKAEAADRHADVRALLELHDFEAAGAILERFRPDLVPFRDAGLFASVMGPAGELRRLDQQIQARLDPIDPNDRVLPGLLAAYLKLNPKHADYRDLAAEFPAAVIGKTVLTNTATGMKFMYVGCGTFQMGSPASEANRSSDETIHTVELTDPFYLGVYPVTVGEFEKFVNAKKGFKTEAEKSGGAYGLVGGQWKQDASITWRTPGFAQTDRHPVVCVSWNDARAMVAWLNEVEKNGLVYALPTEAQWEYACRAGKQTAYFWGDDAGKLGDHAWFTDNSGNRTYPVETKKPNPWGLCHMSGHIWEWCEDWYGQLGSESVKNPRGCVSGGSSRVLRGGSWYDNARDCRSAYRGSNDPSRSDACDGFRLTVSLRS